MAGKYMRGAILQYMPTSLGNLPNVIVFQYNPETITHTWNQPEASRGDETHRADPLALRGLPGESFSMSISMDASDMIADGSPVAVGIATKSGIYTRLAALEMLLFPADATQGAGLVGSISASAGGVGAGVERPVPESVVPMALFVWGAGRIVPVRVTNLTVTEKVYDVFLTPTHADATLALRVLTPEELSAMKEGALKEIANAAYKYSQRQRQALAVANLTNAAESTIGILPF